MRLAGTPMVPASIAKPPRTSVSLLNKADVARDFRIATSTWTDCLSMLEASGQNRVARALVSKSDQVHRKEPETLPR